jgi:hypothetical protein
MSDWKQELRKAIRQLAGTDNIDGVTSFDCTVDSVNEDEFTCDVTAIGGNATTTVPGVRIASESNDGFKLIPKVGSTVTIVMTERGLAYVAMYSDIEKVVFMDGTYGGIVKVKDPLDLTAGLLNKVNNLENQQNQILTILKAVSIPLAPSGTYPFAPLFTALNNLTPTTEGDIVNNKIKHGI